MHIWVIKLQRNCKDMIAVKVRKWLFFLGVGGSQICFGQGLPEDLWGV